MGIERRGNYRTIELIDELSTNETFYVVAGPNVFNGILHNKCVMNIFISPQKVIANEKTTQNTKTNNENRKQ